jgi:DNA-binding SARP family transcriptional activator
VSAFEKAITSGEDVAALDLYRGPLLDGFHISGTLEFERWVDSERMRLAASAAAAGLELARADEENGNAVRALYWTRRVLAIRPDDECALRRTIGLLNGTGDRAAAIRVYDEFRRRIQADYGLEPSAPTRELIAAVRSEAIRE